MLTTYFPEGISIERHLTISYLHLCRGLTGRVKGRIELAVVAWHTEHRLCGHKVLKLTMLQYIQIFIIQVIMRVEI